MVIVVIILDLSHPILWLVGHVCSNKADFFFLWQKINWHQLRHAPLNRDEGSLLLDAYLHLVKKQGSLFVSISKELLLQRLDHP